jgi:hypothetical protein
VKRGFVKMLAVNVTDAVGNHGLSDIDFKKNLTNAHSFATSLQPPTSTSIILMDRLPP